MGYMRSRHLPSTAEEAERGSEGGARARRRRPADLLTFAVACRSPAIPLPSTRPSAKPSTNASAPSNPSPAQPSTSTPSYAVRPVDAMWRRWCGAARRGALFPTSFSFSPYRPPPSLSLSEYYLFLRPLNTGVSPAYLTPQLGGLITSNFPPRLYPRPSSRFSRSRVGKVLGRRVFRFSLSPVLISRRISS
jgi:hypothetical protein